MQLGGLLAVSVLLFSHVTCNLQELESARQAVVSSNNAFSTDLYQALRNESGNLVISPVSVSAVMAMVWLGAGGETARQLAAGLHLPDSRSQVEDGFKTFLSSLQSTRTLTLDMANKLYVQQGFSIKDTFRRTAVDSFRSDAEEVDFANNTEVARVSINQWVEEKTHNKIKDLLEQGSLTEDTLMVVVNAIYFKGGWRRPFSEEETTTELFHLTSKSSVNVSMMHQTKRFSYGEVAELSANAIRLPYRGGNDAPYGVQEDTKSMLILLPNEVDGLNHLEAHLSSLNLTRLSRSMRTKEIVLSLPKFKVDTTLKLTDALRKLGISNLFRPGANLTGITDNNVYVNKVVQKAFVEVTEKGTEAAAATYLEVIPEMLERRVDFNVDHPFLFMIMDDSTDAILFAGRVADPR